MPNPRTSLTSPRRSSIVLALAASTVLAVATVAFAQASVVVEVRNSGGEPVDGEVVLTSDSEGGRSFSCQTARGSCELAGVPGGRYVATLRPRSGEAPAPRSVMIPPSGRVTLRVSAR